MESRIIECPCGTVLRGDSDAAVIAEARTHARDTHEMDLSEEQAASMVRPG